MNTPGSIERDPLVGNGGDRKNDSDFLPDAYEGASRASYDKYHKVCDMRAVSDCSIIGCCGILLTFFLVFTSWCGWHETIEWWGVSRNLEGRSLIEFAAIVNAISAAIFVILILAVRFIVGPILSYHWRSVFAVLLVMTAITLWETIEGVVDILIGSNSSERAIGYLIACGTVCIVTFIFEKYFEYDVIGNHLLTPP